MTTSLIKSFNIHSIILFAFLVPPNIDDSLSSSDIIVRENSNVTLKCRAHGSPQPTIKWKRDDNSKININKSLSGEYAARFRWRVLLILTLERFFIFYNIYTVYDWDGDVLEITKISRLDMGAYLCIASNTVPPSVSKRIKVSVDCEYQIIHPLIASRSRIRKANFTLLRHDTNKMQISKEQLFRPLLII